MIWFECFCISVSFYFRFISVFSPTNPGAATHNNLVPGAATHKRSLVEKKKVLGDNVFQNNCNLPGTTTTSQATAIISNKTKGVYYWDHITTVDSRNSKGDNTTIQVNSRGCRHQRDNISRHRVQLDTVSTIMVKDWVLLSIKCESRKWVIVIHPETAYWRRM